MKTQTLLSRAALLALTGRFVALAIGGAEGPGSSSSDPIPGSVYRFDASTSQGLINRAGASPNIPPISVLPAEGTRTNTDAQTRSFFVLSNSSSFAIGPNSGFTILRLSQEPFAPHRSDIDSEPSKSIAAAELTHGTLSLSTGLLATGSEFRLETPECILSGQGDTRYRLALETNDGQTIVTLLEGTLNLSLRDSNAWSEDTLRPDQQAVLRSPAIGRHADIQVRSIPPHHRTRAEQTIHTAGQARKKVYFEIDEPSPTSVSQAHTIRAIKVFPAEPREAGNMVNRSRQS